MFYLLRLIWDNFREIDEKYRDRRSENYFFSSPLQMSLTVLAYYVFVRHIGPKFMKNRQAFDLKYVLLAYNAAQVLYNSVLVVMGVYYLSLYKPYDRLTCMLPVFNRPIGMVELNLCYAYYLLKLVDLADTVFFVLRKRFNQASFLHIYHHMMITVSTFIFMRYLPGGHATVVGLLNVIVHSIMYFYYFITALRPGLKQSLWWKKHITQVQILQFGISFVHLCRALFDKTCEYPRVALYFGVFQEIVMLVLFSDFYYKTYLRPSKRKLVSQASAEKNGDTSAESLPKAGSTQSAN